MPVKHRYWPILVAILVAACDSADEGQAQGGWDRVPQVVTAPVELKPMVDEIQALGTARANESVSIRPRLPSIVSAVAFEEGQMVDAGDLLIELENSEIRAGLALAEASLTESRSLYERSRSLESRRAISASDLDQLLAQVKVNEAQVEAARARLANTLVRAPFAGRVGLRQVSPGSFVDSSTEITTLDDIETIKLDFSVPETFLAVISEGMTIEASSVVFPDRVFIGQVESVDTRLDPVSRSILVRAVLPNDTESLRPGMFMTVDLQQERGDVLVVPEQSIVPEGLQQFVFVVADGIVERRTVLLGRRMPGFVVIEDGLQAGEQVITEGTNKVRDGGRVEILNDAALLGATRGEG